MVAVLPRERHKSRTRSETGPREVTLYLGPSPVPGVEEGAGPQAYLVTSDPGDVVEPHFHEVDQFQVVVGGTGTIGREVVRPVTIHYADAFTPYGPLKAGPSGLSYLTLRDRADRGVHVMPASRDRLRREPRTSPATHVQSDVAATVELRDIGSTVIETLCGGRGRPGILEVRIPAGAGWVSTAAARAAAQYALVVAGNARVQGRRCTAGTLVHIAGDDGDVRIDADDLGVQLLSMEFPT